MFLFLLFPIVCALVEALSFSFLNTFDKKIIFCSEKNMASPIASQAVASTLMRTKEKMVEELSTRAIELVCGAAAEAPSPSAEEAPALDALCCIYAEAHRRGYGAKQLSEALGATTVPSGHSELIVAAYVPPNAEGQVVPGFGDEHAGWHTVVRVPAAGGSQH